eukprot:1160450-Pelagomonas_calceolata.AAC.15
MQHPCNACTPFASKPNSPASIILDLYLQLLELCQCDGHVDKGLGFNNACMLKNVAQNVLKMWQARHWRPAHALRELQGANIA